MKKWAGILSVLLIVLPVTLFWGNNLLFGQKDSSNLENRRLQQLPSFSIEDYMSGTFQNSLEEAIGDQMPGSETIRSGIKDLGAAFQNAILGLLQRTGAVNTDSYIRIADGYYQYRQDTNRIVQRPKIPSGGYTISSEIRSVLDGLKKADHINAYLYFIENSRSVDFLSMEDPSQACVTVMDCYDFTAAGRFSFSDYEEFCTLFYQTDHHWNYRGSYQGYRDIISIMKPDDEPVLPADQIDLPVVFNGSYARLTKDARANEGFSFYTFQLVKHTETLNGKRGQYGRLNAYEKGRYETGELTNHYANCYGGEYGEIIYDFGDNGHGNLLLIASSYSNPINALLASHYDKTYVIDLRYYEQWTGRPFDAAEYAKDCCINDVLLLGDVEMFMERGEEEAQ